MCAIVGFTLDADGSAARANAVLSTILRASRERGRDGMGYRLAQDGDVIERRFLGREQWDGEGLFDTDRAVYSGTLLANLRAEPTTEYVADKHWQDQQPYVLGKWSVVHNGTIANDHELRTNALETRIDSAAIAELLAEVHGGTQPPSLAFTSMLRDLKGSYAIIATHDDEPGLLYVACNYRPIWWAKDDSGTYLASARHYFPPRLAPQMLPPYSAWLIDDGGAHHRLDPRPWGGDGPRQRALVVCSGGLDSVVAASEMVRDGAEVTLLHFRYGSRAEGPEVAAVQAVAHSLGVPLLVAPMDVYDPADSPLLRADSTIAGGEAGAEYAHEWVPARNLVMLALATAMAEARGFDVIVLGNNLEEAGAYPDNEPEFVARFNDLLPFAVGDGRRVRVAMPVGNLMKHEIVALGHANGAPMNLTWSCYRAGPIHCGTCGPCHMRRTAFAINGLPEVIQYAKEA